RSHDVEEPVHVAEALHRTAEAKDESGGAGHEALPAEGATLPGPEGESDCVVRLRKRAGRDAALVLRLVGDAFERHADVKLRDRESVRREVGIEDGDRLDVHFRRADAAERSVPDRVAAAGGSI